ncbi:hypothetical protein Acsp06_27820 [Actinomycetospora sp. NBRC 106375]|uniref:hypothetical protein n=1 Tax=Actinomycetospora sp. NBRC 106375 TaxID=3032207 RepID=UPI0024A5F530|nr:hypothetical protein [Actinomycetospora sp. NBRC 106375]GLZ46597.1 hypothetical protein Acsp06_27820 [Actinomycetospora sp. NBRC 106375]
MGILRKSVLATTLIGAGLAATTGSAFAQDGDTQSGMGNVDDVQTITPANACNNNVPVNVLGVQVPVQDVAGTIPVLSPAEHGSEQAAGVSKKCGNEVGAENG